MTSKDLVLGFQSAQLISEGVVDEEAVRAVRTWSNHAKLPALSDEQIILFLVACDRNVEFAQDTIQVYFKIKRSSPQHFCNRRLHGDDVQNALRTGRTCLWKDEEGCAILFYRFSRDVRQWNLSDSAKLSCMVLESAVFDYPPKGFHIVIDIKELSLQLAMKSLNPSVLSIIFNYYQRAVPIKLMALHVLNSPYWAPKLLQMLSPFLNSKIVEQIIFYPKSLTLEELRERCRFPLPSDLGGELPSVDVLQERLIEKMESMSAYYEAEELQR